MNLRTFIKAIILGCASLWPFSKLFKHKLGYAREGITRAELTVIKTHGVWELETLKGRQASLELQKLLKWQRKGEGSGNPIDQPSPGESRRTGRYMRGVFKAIDALAKTKDENGNT